MNDLMMVDVKANVDNYVSMFKEEDHQAVEQRKVSVKSYYYYTIRRNMLTVSY
jgi:hypothetical protein